jgi:threonine synthase
MGLPIGKLILATNENNILERFIKEGVYMPGDFRMTYSPSMDIQVASNFERYLYYVLGEDSELITKLMEQFKVEGEISISGEALAAVQAEFAAHGVLGVECLSTISAIKTANDYLLDPHSACGVAAAKQCSEVGQITVSLATAHPAKFNEAIELCGIEQQYPEQIQVLFNKEQRQTRITGDKEAIAEAIQAFYKK